MIDSFDCEYPLDNNNPTNSKNLYLATIFPSTQSKVFLQAIYIPGSSKCVKFVPFRPKFLPKGRILTYLEGPGIYTPPKIQVYIYIPSGLEDDVSFQRGDFQVPCEFSGVYI